MIVVFAFLAFAGVFLSIMFAIRLVAGLLMLISELVGLVGRALSVAFRYNPWLTALLLISGFIALYLLP